MTVLEANRRLAKILEQPWSVEDAAEIGKAYVRAREITPREEEK